MRKLPLFLVLMPWLACSQILNYDFAHKMMGVSPGETALRHLPIVVNNQQDSYIFANSAEFDQQFILPNDTVILNVDSTTYSLSSVKFNGQFNWRKRWKDYYGMSWSNYMVLPNDEIIITGHFYLEQDLDPGPVIEMAYASPDYPEQSFILWLNSDGTYNRHLLTDQWIQDLKIMNVRSSGNLIFQCLGYADSCDLDFGPGTQPCDPNEGPYFLIETDTLGNYYQHFGLQQKVYYSVVSPSTNELVYQLDYEIGEMVDLDPGNGTFFLNELDTCEKVSAFVHLDENFTFNQAIGFGASVYSYSIDSMNNMAVHLNFENKLDMDPGVGLNIVDAGSHWNSDIALVYLDSNRNYIRGHHYNLKNGANGFTTYIRQFNSGKSLAVFRVKEDTIDLDPGPAQTMIYCDREAIVIALFETDGSLKWHEEIHANEIGWSGMALTEEEMFSEFGIHLSDVYFTKHGDTLQKFDHDAGNNNQLFFVKSQMCGTTQNQHVLACDSLQWINGNTYYNSTQSVYYHDTSINGCDSIIHLIYDDGERFSDDFHFTCLPYTWVNGVTYFQEGNDLDSMSYSTIHGCDSMVYLSVQELSTISTVEKLDFETLKAMPDSANYQWVKCDTGLQMISGANAQNYTVTTPGIYACIVQIGDLCADTTNCIDFSDLFVGNPLTTPKIHISPNPNSGIFSIQTPTAIMVQIFDLSGRFLRSYSLKEGENLIQTDLSSGHYLVKIEGEGRVQTKRIIVSK